MKWRRVRIFDVLLLSVLTACTIDVATKMDDESSFSARQAFQAGDTLMKLGGAKNEALAARYYKRAADMGSHWGHYKYGTMLLEGKGVPKDVPAAAQSFAKAAEEDNAWAQYQLGVLYVDGNGVAKDVPRGMALLDKAAEQNIGWAQYRLGDLYATGADVPQDLVKARDYLEKAAAQDITYAQFALANLIIDKDPQRAKTLLQKAAAAGNQLAVKRLAQLTS
jgi:TPR repeat protein